MNEFNETSILGPNSINVASLSERDFRRQYNEAKALYEAFCNAVYKDLT